LAKKWDKVIDWEARKKSENGFFKNILDKHQVKNVLDIACGTGFHSIHLTQQGFNVTAADGSEDMLKQTKDNARLFGFDNLQMEKVDWLYITDTIKEEFDAVICLGNSITHLFYENYYRKAIKEIFKVLKKGGVFIVDQRNYDVILDEGFQSKHKYYYCGEEVKVEPVVIQNDLIVFTYKFNDNERYYLSLHPIRKDNLTAYLLDAGFKNIDIYGDFKKNFLRNEADFIIQVAVK